MNSSVFSISSVRRPDPVLVMPAPSQLVEMIQFYATAEVRSLLMSPFESDCEPLITELVTQLQELIATWQPTTEWHWSHVHLQGRTIEWLAWQVAISTDPELGPIFRDEPIIPYAINLGTLPLFDQVPVMLVHPDAFDDVSLPASIAP